MNTPAAQATTEFAGAADLVSEMPMPDGDRFAGCRSGCVLVLVVLATLTAATAGLGIFFFSWLDDDSSSQNNAPTTTTTQPEGLAFQNIYNPAGGLMPIAGLWDMQNESGNATCIADMPLEANLQRGELRVDGEGASISVRTPGSDTWFDLDRISSSASEAIYYADLSDQTGIDFEMTLVFSSSSTIGGRLEGCPDRGLDGWLVEPGGTGVAGNDGDPTGAEEDSGAATGGTLDAPTPESSETLNPDSIRIGADVWSVTSEASSVQCALTQDSERTFAWGSLDNNDSLYYSIDRSADGTTEGQVSSDTMNWVAGGRIGTGIIVEGDFAAGTISGTGLFNNLHTDEWAYGSFAITCQN